MSYYAKGFGTLKFRYGVDPTIVLDGMLSIIPGPDADATALRNGTYDLHIPDSEYDYDAVADAMTYAEPYLDKNFPNSIKFVGEDDNHWKICIENGHAVERNGYISYIASDAMLKVEDILFKYADEHPSEKDDIVALAKYLRNNYD